MGLDHPLFAALAPLFRGIRTTEREGADRWVSVLLSPLSLALRSSKDGPLASCGIWCVATAVLISPSRLRPKGKVDGENRGEGEASI